MKTLTAQIQCYRHAWQPSPSPAAILPPESTRWRWGAVSEMIEGVALLANYGVFCPPAGATIKQRIQIIIAYIEARPQRMHEDFRVLAVEAMQKAWPCKIERCRCRYRPLAFQGRWVERPPTRLCGGVDGRTSMQPEARSMGGMIAERLKVVCVQRVDERHYRSSQLERE
jgi:Rap1a immunity proteins